MAVVVVNEIMSVEDSCSEEHTQENKPIHSPKSIDEDQNSIISHLYCIEKRVKRLREQALEMEQEKCSILQQLQEVQDNYYTVELSEDERDEVEALAERLICRCLTVEVNVTTPRNESQEAALKRVHELLQQLEALCEHSVGKAVVRTKAYLNACLAEPVGCIDQKFQGAILSCTIDDQKSVKCRLKSLLEDLSKTNQDVL